MGFARSVLLKASRSQWLARQLRERRFFQRAVKRFMPGETLDAALDATSQFAKAGLGSVLTELGEQVSNRIAILVAIQAAEGFSSAWIRIVCSRGVE